MKTNDWKDKLASLLPADYVASEEEQKEEPTIKPEKQTLRIELDRRKGKLATIISEFEGTDEELKDLAKTLKNRCASGGSQRGGEILIQGDFRVKVADILQSLGYKVRKINFK